MNTKIIDCVNVFPSDLKAGKNNEYEFKMRCREVMRIIGLGLAWDNSRFIPDRGGFWFRVGCFDSVIIHNPDENTRSITWVQENGTMEVLDVPVLKLEKTNLFSMQMQDSTLVEFEYRKLNHLEKLGLSVLLQSPAS